jgi:uncharacterized membrane protein
MQNVRDEMSFLSLEETGAVVAWLLIILPTYYSKRRIRVISKVG